MPKRKYIQARYPSTRAAVDAPDVRSSHRSAFIKGHNHWTISADPIRPTPLNSRGRPTPWNSRGHDRAPWRVVSVKELPAAP